LLVNTPSANDRRVVLLCTESESASILYHYLDASVNIVAVIVENKPSRKRIIKRRIKILGVLTVIGQILFVLAMPLLFRTSRIRIAEIIEDFGLNPSDIPDSQIFHVRSANSKECRDALNSLSPDIVVIHGTRILSKRTLAAVESTFVNIHAGITPKYRGVHGGYWAAVAKDDDNLGVTLHVVDSGIDTGGILSQATVSVDKVDSFATYPLLQLVAALPELRRFLTEEDTFHLYHRKDLESRLWSHPTLWGYLYQRVFHRVR
jgi:methionyl-tRNA formyltransferase